jgi:hypothetical protein
MKQPNDFRCLGVYTRDVRPFVIVACKTRECEILQFMSPMMFASNNVINLEGQEIILLREPTILAN